MGLFDFGRRRRPIVGTAALADFIDEQSAFIVQKGIFEYSRARAGHYAKVLFAEQTFIDMLERSRWQAFPLGLAMVGEVTENVLNPFLREAGGPDSRLDGLSRLNRVVLSVFDRYAQPATLDPVSWLAAREKLAHDLDLIGLHPPKMAKDIPERFAEPYTELMPIHKNLRRNEGPTIRNYLKVTMCNIHDELSGRLDGRAVAADLLAQPFETN
jgi:hypothetical protein